MGRAMLSGVAGVAKQGGIEGGLAALEEDLAPSPHTLQDLFIAQGRQAVAGAEDAALVAGCGDVDGIGAALFVVLKPDLAVQGGMGGELLSQGGLGPGGGLYQVVRILGPGLLDATLQQPGLLVLGHLAPEAGEQVVHQSAARIRETPGVLGRVAGRGGVVGPHTRRPIQEQVLLAGQVVEGQVGVEAQPGEHQIRGHFVHIVGLDDFNVLLKVFNGNPRIKQDKA